MKKYIAYIIFSLTIFHVQTLSAHENWILSSVKNNNNKEKIITVKVCNGHNFPTNNLLLKKRVINYIKVITPENKTVPVNLNPGKNYLKGKINATSNGTYIISAALKNPPRYFLKSIFTIGNSEKKISLKTGTLLEIVPDKIPGKKLIGKRLKLKILFNGKPVTCGINISINGKNNLSSFTNNKGIFSLKIRKRGLYLITSSVRGKSCSLVFRI